MNYRQEYILKLEAIKVFLTHDPPESDIFWVQFVSEVLRTTTAVKKKSLQIDNSDSTDQLIPGEKQFSITLRSFYYNVIRTSLSLKWKMIYSRLKLLFTNEKRFSIHRRQNLGEIFYAELSVQS